MRIAYLVSMFPCWSETFVLNELSNHFRAGVDITIFSLKKCNEKLIQSEATPFIKNTVYLHQWFDIRLWFLHLRLFVASPKKYLTILRKLAFLESRDPIVKLRAIFVFFLSPRFIVYAKKNNIEHLHAHFAVYPAIAAWFIASFTDISFSVTAHAYDIFVNQDLLGISYENASAIFAISEFNKKFIIEKMGSANQEKIKVLHCGINIDRFSFRNTPAFPKQENGNLAILSIGRLSEKKGFSYLLTALKLLSDEGVNFTCRIIGDGPLKDSLIKQANKLAIADRVIFLGSKRTEDILSFFAETDIFILASVKDQKGDQEGIPVVLMEAMALGVPVIGTKLSGIPELIQHGKTGLCAKPEDPVSLKEMFQYLIKNPEIMENMRYQSRLLIEQEFDIEQIAPMQRELFCKIIQEQKKG